jgi:hypothetical protein
MFNYTANYSYVFLQTCWFYCYSTNGKIIIKSIQDAVNKQQSIVEVNGFD